MRLLTNPVHLLLTPKRAERVPKLIISLGRRYGQYINTRYRRTSTLWDSRYKSSLIQADHSPHRHALPRNEPRSRGNGRRPAHYRWTSYRANALGQTSPLLVPHPTYLALGAADKARRVAYRGLFRPHLDDETLSDIRLALIPLGNERFYAKIERMTGQRREVRSRVGRG